MAGPVDASTGGENDTVTDYAALSSEKQQVFDEARTGETIETPVWHSDEEFVRSQGELYRVDDGGISTGNNILYFGIGMVVIPLGILELSVQALAWVVRNLRRRR